MSIATTLVDLEEIETTKTEKLLAVVLTVFLLIGGIWLYAKIDDTNRQGYHAQDTYYTASERAAIELAAVARNQLDQAEIAVQAALQDLELSREAYRTALDAGRPGPALENAYRNEQRDYAAAQRAVQTAQGEVSAAQPAADSAAARASSEAQAASNHTELVTFAERLGFVLVALAFGFWLLVRLRRSNSHYLTVGFAFVGFATLLALVMAGDYLTDYLDVMQLGPVVLSLAGIALTLVTFWWLQRYLARRVPPRRVRKGDCPFCGYPVRSGQHCDGCGRTVIAECTTCHEPRRLGTFHCGTCGAA